MTKEISLLERMAEIVFEAGEIILHAESQRDHYEKKGGNGNYVTEYDSRVQNFLFERLAEIVPDASFMGEEEGKGSFKKRYKEGKLFVIDPIDGTSNFINGYFPAVISVALLDGGEPLIGMIYNPYNGQIYFAKRGEGAYVATKDGGLALKESIQTSKKPLSESLVSFGTAHSEKTLWDETFRIARAYLTNCADLRRCGAAAWDLCMLASGHIGIFYECILNPWDYAAGLLLITEAGGGICKMNGEPLDFDGPSSVMAYSAGIKDEELIFTDMIPVDHR